jgi:hypothetical protein
VQLPLLFEHGFEAAWEEPMARDKSHPHTLT